MKQQLLSAITLALLCCVLSVPLSAGTAYVPIINDVVPAEYPDVSYSTELWFSNPSDANRRFSTHFIDTNTDGTARPDNAGSPETTVRFNGTVLVNDPVDNATHGMLEIEGAPQLVVQAWLVSSVGGSGRLGVNLPVVDDTNIFEADAQAHVQALSRTATRTSDLVIMNLSDEAATCTVEMYRANGAELLAPTQLQLKALSHNQYEDVLNIIGVTNITGARAQVTCDERFYSFGLTYQPLSGEAAVLMPSSQPRLGDVTAPPPPPPPPSECPAGGECFYFNGEVHRPTPGNEVKRLSFPFQPNRVFKKINVRMTVTHGGWDSQAPDGIHNFFWLARNKYRSNTFGYVNTRGPQKLIVTSLTNAGLPAGVTQRKAVNYAMIPGITYRIDYTYDTNTGLIELFIFDQDDLLVINIVDFASVNRIVTEGAGFIMDLGLKRVGVDVPTYGWRYSNLAVEFLP